MQEGKDTWNLKDIFENEEEWKKAKEEVESRIERIAKYQGKLGSSPENLLKCYQEYTNLLEVFEKVFAYAMLCYHQDMGEAKRIENYKAVEKLNAEVSMKLAFFTPEIIEIKEEVLKEYIENPEFKPYKRSIEEMLKQKKHVLTKEIEEVLSSYSEVFGANENTYEVLCDVDLKFPKIKGKDGKEIVVTQENFISHMKSKDREIRKQAFHSIYSTYESFIHTISELYLARVKQVTSTCKMRKYSSSLECAVENDDATPGVYENLVEVVQKNVELNHRYMRLKKKLLGLEEMHFYDIYTNPIAIQEENISFEESKKIILEVLQPMGEEYLSVIQKAFENGWLDVYERENKKTGGYNLGIYGVHPYVLLNYQSTLRDTSTIIHELGHCMHSWYSNQNQNVLDADYTIMMAEVASTVNEMLLGEYLIQKETDKRKKAELILEQLENMKATLIKQTMFSEFEKIVHEKIEAGEILTSEDLCDIYYRLNQYYFGKDMIIDKEIRYEWARIPHFYRCFYVYKYATGISAAIAISDKILAGEEGFVEKYITMLKQGCSQKSVNLLRMVGVDLETKQPYEKAFERFEKYLSELEELV